ncbi:MAG TPA: hypothetical protein VMA09_21725 [Candidatus Binataceae bacterium]|nr:hypothetical protein [Candidatus Binataceae bacterium]
MFNSTVLDVAVGVVFTFLAVSLAVSTATEALASILSWRAATLLQGVKDLLNDQNFSGLALQIYNHAMVSPRDDGKAESASDLKNLPAYIDPSHFADALIDITGISSAAPGNIRSTILENVKDNQLRVLLLGVVERAGGDVNNVRHQIATWFDNGMDRVGGAYKRKIQFCSFIIALILAIGLNISATDISKALWTQPLLARTIAPSSPMDAQGAFDKLYGVGMPIGWSIKKFNNLKTPEGLDTVAGWLITAIATLFGAPFWFDALERVVRLKGSGPSPAEKASGMGAAA